MNCDIIEQEFRAAEDYAKVRRLKPEGMKHFLNDLNELESETQKEDITPIVLKVINDSRFDDQCKMKPALVFRIIVKLVDPLKVSHWWAD